MGISEAIDTSQPAIHVQIEATRRNVGVLRLDLKIRTLSLARPHFGSGKQCPAHSKSTHRWFNSKIPESGQVAPAFQKVNIGSVVGNDGTANSLAVNVRCQVGPSC